MRSKIFILGFLLLMVWFNAQIYTKEHSRVDGTRLVLELVPVDPRSLMQGDYMILNYRLARLVVGDDKSGIVYLKPDEKDLATQPELNQEPGMIPLKYHRRNGRVQFEVESYLFQEGQQRRYQRARYSELRVSVAGKPELIRLLDENFRPI